MMMMIVLEFVATPHTTHTHIYIYIHTHTYTKPNLYSFAAHLAEFSYICLIALFFVSLGGDELDEGAVDRIVEAVRLVVERFGGSSPWHAYNTRNRGQGEKRKMGKGGREDINVYYFEWIDEGESD